VAERLAIGRRCANLLNAKLSESITGRGIVKLPALVFNGRMNMPTTKRLSYSGYRFPAVIISHCTWLYFRFALS
jgi:hypothetical protein